MPVAAGLYYAERGSGPPLVLSHGVIESSRSFAALAELLAARFRTIAYDARGRGRSAGGRVDYGVLAADVALLAEELELGPFHHVGHSMGGRIVLEHALARPEQVRRIAVVSARAEAPQEAGRRRLRELIAAARRDGPAAAVDMWVDRSDPLYDQVAGISAANPLEGTLAALECLVDMDSLVERLPEVSPPALIVAGDRDDGYLRSARLMATEIPAELVVLEGVGHFPNLEAPELLADLLTGFLAG